MKAVLRNDKVETIPQWALTFDPCDIVSKAPVQILSVRLCTPLQRICAPHLIPVDLNIYEYLPPQKSISVTEFDL